MFGFYSSHHPCYDPLCGGDPVGITLDDSCCPDLDEKLRKQEEMKAGGRTLDWHSGDEVHLPNEP